MLSANLQNRLPPPVPKRRRVAGSSSSTGAIFSAYRMNDIPRGTTYSKLMNSLLTGPNHDVDATPRSHVHCGLIMTDSRLDDELSVATVDFTDTPKWLLDLARDANGFPKKSAFGTLWHMTGVSRTAVDEDGKTEFIRAVIKGVDRASLFYPEMLAEFDDIDVNVQDNRGRTALHWASENGLVDMVGLCLSVPGCDTGLRDNDGLTAFDLSNDAVEGDGSISAMFYTSIIEMGDSDPQRALLRALTITSQQGEDRPIFPGEAIFDPIRDRNSPLVTALIDRHIDLTFRDEDGNTALHVAAGQAKNTEIMTKLLDAGADIDAKGDVSQYDTRVEADVNGIGAGGVTALHVAVSIADQQLVQVLLKRNADVTVKDTDGMTALQCAVRDGDGQISELLEQHSISVQDDEKAMQSPEYVAGIEVEWRREWRRELLQRYEQLDTNHRRAAIVRATIEGDLESLVILLEMGVDMEVTDSDNMSLILLASKSGFNAIVEVLLDAGVDVNKDNTNGTPASFASENGHVEVVKTLVAAGAYIEGSLDMSSPLQLASQYGHTEVVKTLLAAGADIEGSRGWKSPLQSASEMGDIEMVKTLLVGGADVEAATGGKTPLQLASQQGHDEIADLLRAAGGRSGAARVSYAALKRIGIAKSAKRGSETQDG